MAASGIECHRRWIEQCAAAQRIKQRFGLGNAPEYLVEEKLLRFVETAQHAQSGYFLQPRRAGAVFLLSGVCEIETSILARAQGIGAGWRGATETHLSSTTFGTRRASTLGLGCFGARSFTLPKLSVVGKAVSN